MHVQAVLTALVALSTVSDAAIIRGKFPFTRSLQKRQFGGGFGGGFNGGNFDNNGGFGGGNFDSNNGGGNDQAQDDNNNNSGNNGDSNNGGSDNGGGSTTLSGDAIQQGSASDGDPNAADGESASATDDANFINFCQGQDLTNGEQKEGGSCNGIPMGKIPGTGNMVASVFTSPQNGDDVEADQDFTVSVQMLNFAPGTFTNADTTYYSAPQDLDGSGNIIGHTHVTIQDTGGDLNPTQPMDPTQFAFFKGINDAGDGNGLLSANVDGGLPAGNYRLCSMASSANHQPVLMPVAQRGAQDDCVRFTVGANSNGGNDNSNNGDNNSDNNGDSNNDNNSDNNDNNSDNNDNNSDNNNDSNNDSNQFSNSSKSNSDHSRNH